MENKIRHERSEHEKARDRAIIDFFSGPKEVWNGERWLMDLNFFFEEKGFAPFDVPIDYWSK